MIVFVATGDVYICEDIWYTITITLGIILKLTNVFTERATTGNNPDSGVKIEGELRKRSAPLPSPSRQ